MARRPEQAVLDHIAGVRWRGRSRETALVGAPTAAADAGDAKLSIGGTPWVAHLETVEILKERVILGRRVYVVRFLADHTRLGRVPMTMVVRAERVTGLGWIARGISAGADVTEPRLAEPRVLLGGSWGRFGFCGGGKVYGPRGEIDGVRLRFRGGTVLEDDAESGWVLFFTDEPVERPDATVELLDAAGAVAASHPWPADPDLPEALRRRIPRA